MSQVISFRKGKRKLTSKSIKIESDTLESKVEYDHKGKETEFRMVVKNDAGQVIESKQVFHGKRGNHFKYFYNDKGMVARTERYSVNGELFATYFYDYL